MAQTNLPTITLREVMDADLDVFFSHQQDQEAVYMAAFTAKDPSDRAAFDAHWAKIRGMDTVTIRTILVDGVVVGSVMSFPQFGEREISYWIGREYWGRGVATEALRRFLLVDTIRPLHGRAAKDNTGSVRVMEKCGFTIIGEDKGYANARSEEIEEYVLMLPADA